MKNCACCCVYLVILICCDSGELSAREDEGLPSLPVEAVDVIRLHNVEAWLVSVHAVHNNLQRERERERERERPIERTVRG